MRTIDAPPRRSLVLGAGASALTALFAACGFHTSGELPSGTTSGTTSSTTTSSSSGGAGGAMTTSTSATTTTGTGGAGGATSTSTTSSSTTGTGGGTTGTGGSTTGTGGMGTGGGGGDGGVVTYASCADLHKAKPSEPSGVYELLPITGTAYQAYCEMESSGGGWTLALKIDGNAGTFNYANGIWTDTNALAPDQPDLDNKEAKLASYWSIPVTALRLGMIEGGTTRWKEITVQGSSLQSLIGGATQVMTAYGVGFWEGLLASGSIQTNCKWEGLNVNNRVRIGLVGDESGDCNSPDSVIGFGIRADFGMSCGNRANYSPDHGDRNTKTFGYVLVR